MTREEKIEYMIDTARINSKQEMSISFDRLEFAMGDILDDFESRTCENCKYREIVFNKIKKHNTEVCRNEESMMFKRFFIEGSMKGFGCPHFVSTDINDDNG